MFEKRRSTVYYVQSVPEHSTALFILYSWPWAYLLVARCMCRAARNACVFVSSGNCGSWKYRILSSVEPNFTRFAALFCVSRSLSLGYSLSIRQIPRVSCPLTMLRYECLIITSNESRGAYEAGAFVNFGQIESQTVTDSPYHGYD